MPWVLNLCVSANDLPGLTHIRSYQINETGNALLAITFGAEAALKMLVLGPARYFDVQENIRDLVSALLTLVGEALNASILQGRDGLVGKYFQDQVFRHIERMLSVARLSGWVRVLRLDDDMKRMVNILILAGGIIFQVVGILLIVLFIFGVVGVQLFGNICSPDEARTASAAIYTRSMQNAAIDAARMEAAGADGAGSSVSDAGESDINYFLNSDGLRCLLGQEQYQLPNLLYFNHLGSAMLTLFVTAMGDGWSGIMIATSRVKANYPRQPGHISRAVEHLREYLQHPLHKKGQGALARARLEFPGCITNEELVALGDAKMVDCFSDGGRACESTCGSTWSKAYFILFYLVANVVVLNIIVAALLEQVAAASPRMRLLMDA